MADIDALAKKAIEAFANDAFIDDQEKEGFAEETTFGSQKDAESVANALSDGVIDGSDSLDGFWESHANQLREKVGYRPVIGFLSRWKEPQNQNNQNRVASATAILASKVEDQNFIERTRTAIPDLVTLLDLDTDSTSYRDRFFENIGTILTHTDLTETTNALKDYLSGGPVNYGYGAGFKILTKIDPEAAESAKTDLIAQINNANLEPEERVRAYQYLRAIDKETGEKLFKRYVVELNRNNFDREFKASSSPWIIDFGYEGCPPCQAMKPVLLEIALKYPEVRVGTIDTHPPEGYPELSQSNFKSYFGGKPVATPTTFLFLRGGSKAIRRAKGWRPASDLEDWMRREHLID